LSFYQLEGFGRGLGRLLSIPSPDYSTLSLRIPKLDLDTGYEPRGGEEVVIAVDSTGIKVTNRGEWMRRKKKGYIKIHVAVDTRTKQVVSIEVSDELLTFSLLTSHFSLSWLLRGLSLVSRCAGILSCAVVGLGGGSEGLP
jgi:hypothetical protein